MAWRPRWLPFCSGNRKLRASSKRSPRRKASSLIENTLADQNKFIAPQPPPQDPGLPGTELSVSCGTCSST